MQNKRTTHERGVWEVQRKITIPTLAEGRTPTPAIEAVEALDGIRSVVVETGKQRLVVAYDASRIDYYTIAVCLSEAGFPPLENWWSNLRARIYQFTDSNARDNANAPAPPCCNKPPK